jgi:hypothetical protein
MAAQYGKEAMYLWAKSGNAFALTWLTKWAQSYVIRLTKVGGAAGLDAITGVGGSRLILCARSGPIYSNPDDWATWLKTLKTSASTTTFATSPSHSINNSSLILQLARDCGVTGLDAALSAQATAKAATLESTLMEGTVVFGNWSKNCGGL